MRVSYYGRSAQSGWAPQNWDRISFDDPSAVLRAAYNLGEIGSADSGGTVANLVTDGTPFGALQLPTLGALTDANLPLNNSLPSNAGGAGLLKTSHGTIEVQSVDHDISTGPFCALAYFLLRTADFSSAPASLGFYLSGAARCRLTPQSTNSEFRLEVDSDSDEGLLANWSLSTPNMLAVGRRDDGSTFSYLNGAYNGGRATCNTDFSSDGLDFLSGDLDSVLIEFACIKGDVSEDDLNNIYNGGHLTLFNAA